MHLCEMIGAKSHIFKYKVLQYSKLFYSKISTGFLRQDLQSSCRFGKIQNLGDSELSEKKMAHHFILLRLNPFGLRVDREGWWF